MKKMFLTVLIITTAFITQAQKVDFEKTYEVDAKAKRGYLNDVIVNPNDKTTCLSFVTRAAGNFTGTKLKVKYQDYYFDADYNFKEIKEYEDVYRNKRYKVDKGEEYSVEGITVMPNLMGDIVLKKKKVEYKWNWYYSTYNKKVTLLDKVKPKDESGNKLTLLKSFDIDEKGEALALVRARPTKNNPADVLESNIIRIDQNLNFETIETIKTDVAMNPKATFILPHEDVDLEDGSNDISNADICIIWSACSYFDETKLGKNTDFEYMRLSNEGKILNRAKFQVTGSDWSIEEAIVIGESIYLIGPANVGKELSTKVQVSASSGTPKYKLYQLAKITGNNVDYVTSTNMDDFEAKLKKPASQKKNPAYSGKRFAFDQASVAPDGSLFICGQNRNSKGEWADVLMFYFDNKGILKAQYGVRLEEVNKISQTMPTNQFINYTKENAYWTVLELLGVKEEAGKSEAPKALIYPSIAKINLATGEINDFVKIGSVKDKPTYFLQNDFPFLVNPADGSQIYLGLNKKGNMFWFGKVSFE